jgi:hypothetical protein
MGLLSLVWCHELHYRVAVVSSRYRRSCGSRVVFLIFLLEDVQQRTLKRADTPPRQVCSIPTVNPLPQSLTLSVHTLESNTCRSQVHLVQQLFRLAAAE